MTAAHEHVERSARRAAAANDDDHADEEHPAEPVLEEPRSPAWLPLLGGALFLLAALGYLITRAPAPAEARGEALAAAETAEQHAAVAVPSANGEREAAPAAPPASARRRDRPVIDRQALRALRQRELPAPSEPSARPWPPPPKEKPVEP